MLRFGLIGTGAIAQAHGQAFGNSQTARLVAVVDLDNERARGFAAEHGASVDTDYRTMLAEQKLDAVIVCTPPATHAEITCAALKSGVAVLCEKPLSISVAEAQLMRESAENSGSLLMMASKFRYVEAIQQAKQAILAGELGEILRVENVFAAPVDMRKRWNADSAMSGGGVLIDNGTHSFDILRYLFGALDAVFAVEGARSQGLAVEETVDIAVRTVSGVQAQIALSWSLKLEQPYFLSIYGSKGVLQVGWQESRIRTSGEWQHMGEGYRKLEAFTAQIENFSAAIRVEETPLVGLEDGVAAAQAVEAAYASLQSETWQDIAQPEMAVG